MNKTNYQRGEKDTPLFEYIRVKEDEREKGPSGYVLMLWTLHAPYAFKKTLYHPLNLRKKTDLIYVVDFVNDMINNIRLSIHK